MVTLAFAQLAYYVIHDTNIAGGTDGSSLAGAPRLSLAGWAPFDVSKPVPFRKMPPVFVRASRLATAISRSVSGPMMPMPVPANKASRVTATSKPM